ncbi:MAG TPA: Zn-dependent exopeptidase M28, partial [bacterium]
MPSNLLTNNANIYLKKLCLEIPTRRVGTKGNQAATDFFASIASSFGFETESPAFDCIDWTQEGAQLSVGGTAFEALVSPYSLGCHINASFIVVSTVEELATAEVANKIILLRGEIAREQLMPKDFPFYNPDEHKRIIQLLETKKPQSIIAATTKNPEMAGAVYPFPFIEDGDFDIPSVYMTEDEGNRLAEQAGKEISLEIRAKRSPSRGCNVIARKGGDPHRRVVLFAHIDSK